MASTKNDNTNVAIQFQMKNSYNTRLSICYVFLLVSSPAHFIYWCNTYIYEAIILKRLLVDDRNFVSIKMKIRWRLRCVRASCLFVTPIKYECKSFWKRNYLDLVHGQTIKYLHYRSISKNVYLFFLYLVTSL